jgi:hypothetical protein
MGPIILTLLYWAEGTKSSFVFTNTDGEMIRVFLTILHRDFGISIERLQILIRLGTHQQKKEILKYWSRITGVSVANLRVNIHPQYNKTTARYGLCRITLTKGSQLLKVVSALQRELTSHI